MENIFMPLLSEKWAFQLSLYFVVCNQMCVAAIFSVVYSESWCQAPMQTQSVHVTMQSLFWQIPFLSLYCLEERTEVTMYIVQMDFHFKSGPSGTTDINQQAWNAMD